MKKNEVFHTCPVCKKQFQDLNYANSKTCSLSCGSILGWSKKPKKEKVACVVCGSLYDGRYKACSFSCGAKLRNQVHGNNRWNKRHSA